MAHISPSSQSSRQYEGTSEYPSQSGGVQDDDPVWIEYINVASIEDVRLVESWNKITDVTLVYVALFSGILTAFIIQTSSRFRPDPRDVTNRLLVAIYNHTTNPSVPIDFEKIYKLEDRDVHQALFLNSLLYSSLALAVAVGAVAMAAKLWIIRYGRDVAAVGPPHVRAKRRQEVYDGSVAWKLGVCIEALPMIALVAEMIFAIFIFVSISEQQEQLGYVVGIILHLGLSFVLVTSFTAAFIQTSPFRSPFSDFVNFAFRIFPARSNPDVHLRERMPRNVAIAAATLLVLALTGYLAFKQIAVAVPLIYLPLASMLALAQEEERDIRPRLYNLPAWVSFSTCVLFIICSLAFYFSANRTTLFYFLYSLMSVLVFVQGFVVVKISQTKAKTADADAIAWLISTSPSPNPDWFIKAAQITGGSPNLRARLLKTLYPILEPLITCDKSNERDERKYLDCLADLVDFKPCGRTVWRNEAALEHPRLSQRLKERLEILVGTGCMHGKQNAKKKWKDKKERCPDQCKSDTAEHILRVLGGDKKDREEMIMETA